MLPSSPNPCISPVVLLTAPGQARAAWASPGSRWPMAGLCFHRERVTSSKLLWLIPGNLLPVRSALCSAAAEECRVQCPFLLALGKAKHKTPTAWEQFPSWGCRVPPSSRGAVPGSPWRGFGSGVPSRSRSSAPGRCGRRGAAGVTSAWLQLPVQLCVALAVLCRVFVLPGVERTYPEPSPIAGGGCVCVWLWQGGCRPPVSPQGLFWECPPQSQTRAAPITFLLLHVLFFSTPFATLLLPFSLHLSLLFPHSSSFLFFCFFSFCSSCLARAAARGDGVVGSSGRWAACRGAFGSSPGSRQARGVRPGTCNHAPRAGAGAGGSRAQPVPRVCRPCQGSSSGATRAQGLASAAACAALSPRLAPLPWAPVCCRWVSEGG